MNGSLTHLDYLNLFNNNEIESPFLNDSQIQPASLDLTLSNECYEIEYSFLCPQTKVRNKLKDLIIKKINLDKKYLFEINKTYIVKLNENLNLKNNIFGHCNPKSSTGRLDIFCRTIVDYTDEYEKIPKNYKGEIFLEVTSRSFNILLKSGDKLNQLRCEKMFIQMLEGLSAEEAELLVWAKDGELNKHYKGLTGNLVKEAFNWNDDYMRNNT